MEKTDIIIVGAGVVGLSIATALSSKDRNIIVVEKEKSFGQGSSSRNSEIVHSGIYYPTNSLKAKLCVEGKNLLYEFCKKHNIPHKKIGKLIVATTDEEIQELDMLLTRGHANGVDDLVFLNKDEIKDIEPNIAGLGAIESPSTGIVDSHQLMKTLESLAKDKGAVFAYSCEVTGIEKKSKGYEVTVRDADGETLKILSQRVINSAGLYSDKIAQMVGIDIEKCAYRLYYNKGEYFRVSNTKANLTNRLIYPTPRKYSLGIHTVMDLHGEMKLGPNAFYVDEIDYNVDKAHMSEFYKYVKDFLPFIAGDDLTPDMAGVRAKVQAEGEEAKDFVISEESKKGFSGLINLIGIESPGLTASLAIAKYVENMV
ncbi:MAG: NAD(P)/FAD-dependent oxidoreductase [Candidatus Omnitrophica bacterium]|nr:NAD(P)/FAD-dependent oxidoreductase [Candidatus Omnitrophota bacterium]